MAQMKRLKRKMPERDSKLRRKPVTSPKTGGIGVNLMRFSITHCLAAGPKHEEHTILSAGQLLTTDDDVTYPIILILGKNLDDSWSYLGVDEDGYMTGAAVASNADDLDGYEVIGDGTIEILTDVGAVTRGTLFIKQSRSRKNDGD